MFSWNSCLLLSTCELSPLLHIRFSKVCWRLHTKSNVLYYYPVWLLQRTRKLMTCYARTVWFSSYNISCQKSRIPQVASHARHLNLYWKNKSREEVRTLPCIVRWLITPFKRRSGTRKNSSNTSHFFFLFKNLLKRKSCKIYTNETNLLWHFLHSERKESLLN